jgi:hypothetical protein
MTSHFPKNDHNVSSSSTLSSLARVVPWQPGELACECNSHGARQNSQAHSTEAMATGQSWIAALCHSVVIFNIRLERR